MLPLLPVAGHHAHQQSHAPRQQPRKQGQPLFNWLALVVVCSVAIVPCWRLNAKLATVSHETKELSRKMDEIDTSVRGNMTRMIDVTNRGARQNEEELTNKLATLEKDVRMLKQENGVLKAQVEKLRSLEQAMQNANHELQAEAKQTSQVQLKLLDTIGTYKTAIEELRADAKSTKASLSTLIEKEVLKLVTQQQSARTDLSLGSASNQDLGASSSLTATSGSDRLTTRADTLATLGTGSLTTSTDTLTTGSDTLTSLGAGQDDTDSDKSTQEALAALREFAASNDATAEDSSADSGTTGMKDHWFKSKKPVEQVPGNWDASLVNTRG